MNDSILRNLLWTYYYYEFFDYSIYIEDEIQYFMNEYEEDEVYICDSDFGYNYDYTGSTRFIPSELKLEKRITNLDTGNTIKLYKRFYSIDDVKSYFTSSTFDDHLQPSFDEEILDELTT